MAVIWCHKKVHVACHKHPRMYLDVILDRGFLEPVKIGDYVLVTCETSMAIIATLNYVNWDVGWTESDSTWHGKMMFHAVVLTNGKFHYMVWERSGGKCRFTLALYTDPLSPKEVYECETPGPDDFKSENYDLEGVKE